ncbi:protein Spindly-like [Babylonia areolata]|uniref:protein Spindly-like n=1 Tax=Babylonia areolata TaxID=304850 RepID=UPI003FD3C3F6
MEWTGDLSPGTAHSRLRQLKVELEERDQNLTQAAMYGKALLEEKKDLRTSIDNLMKQHAKDLEEKQQELSTLHSRLEVMGCTEKWQQEEITNLRSELNNAQSLVEEKNQEIAAHKKQVDSLQQQIDHLHSMEQDLRGQVSDLEALLQTHLDRTQVLSTSTSFTTSEEMATLMEDLTNLRMDLTEAQAKTIEVSGQLQEVKRDRDTISGRLEAAQLEVEDLQCQVSAYSRHLEESRRETLELRAQLEASRVDQQAHNSKGNSIFSEVEDRRLVLEKKMASLKIQNDQLKERYNIEKQQNSRYKMTMAMELQVMNQKEDPTVQRLRDQLSVAHSEIRTLIGKIRKLETSKDEQVTGLAGTGDQFFLATLAIERNKTLKAQGELEAKIMQYMDVSQQIVELSHQNRQLEVDRDRLKVQLLKVTAYNEELLAKYEPDKMKETKAQIRIVEKIDRGDPLTQSSDSTFPPLSGRPSNIFTPYVATGRPSLARNPSSSQPRLPMSGQPSDAFKLTSSSRSVSDVLRPMTVLPKPAHQHSAAPKQNVDRLTEEQKENLNDATLNSDLPFVVPTGRSVKMADDVKVIEANGERSTVGLAEEGGRKGGRGEVLKKPKAPRPAVQYIKGDEAPQLDCKTQ